MLSQLYNKFKYKNIDTQIKACIQKSLNNPTINRENYLRYNYLCSILNNKNVGYDISLVDQNLTDLIYLIFTDASIVAEIHKHFKS